MRTPPSPSDTKAWDLEAIKLQLLSPVIFYKYARDKGGNFGIGAWQILGFGSYADHCPTRSSNVTPEGIALIEACKRLGKEFKT